MIGLALLSCVAALLTPPAAAASPPTFLRQHSQPAGPIVLPLSRRLARLGNDSAPTLKSFYMGTVRVGSASTGPQELLVFFDTGSGQVILDSTRCTSPACKGHRQYAADGQGAVSVNTNGQPVHAGARGDIVTIGLDTNDVEPGKVTGNFVRDTVCLGMERGLGSRAEACAELILVAATNMTAEPFAQVPFDGIVGLGLEGLSISGEYSFFGRLRATTGLLPHFAIFVPPGHQDGRAEITFGGHNEARLASPLAWVPVVRPEQGFWQVAIASIRIGDQPLDLCSDGGCHGVVDSSSSHLGVPPDALRELEGALAADGDDCSTGPELHMALANGVTLTLTAKDYSRREGTKCRAQLHPLLDTDRQKAGRQSIDKKEVRRGGLAHHTFVLGEPVLRRYYTVYDWDTKSVGFGRAAGAAAAAQAASPASPPVERTQRTEEIILLQCKSELKRK